ncbi:MAG: DUF6345 domain-containing protein [Phycisphaerales bacterium]|nr:DUF6345 domain-containing protein [Phycisphaerales bacterium]
MTPKTLAAFAAAVVATTPAMLAIAASPTTQSNNPTNIIIGSDADVPFRTDTPVTLGENLLSFSRIGLKSERGPVDAAGAELSALDGDAKSTISLPADGSTSLEIRFIGQPRWINIVEIEGTLADASIEMLNTDSRWIRWGDSSQDNDAALVRTGEAGRYLGVRITPSGLSQASTVQIAEARARFEQVDMDSANRTEGDGKSYFYEWVENYSSSPLSNTSEDATRLGDKLPSDWDIQGYGNSMAWEEDFKRTEYGGTNNDFADEHDLVFFSGHGSTATASGEYYSDATRCVTFSNSTHDDSRMSAGDAWDSWGDDDMEWLGLSACQTMKQDNRWAASMNGVHLVMGWQTNMYDTPNFGKKFAKRMVDSGAFDSAYTVKSSWFYAAEQTHWYVDRTAEVIGENTTMGSDYLWGEGSVNSDPTDDSYYTRWSYGTRSRDGVLGHQAQEPAGNAIEFRGDAATIRINRDVLNAFNNNGRPHITTFDGIAPVVNAESTGVLSNNLCERLGLMCQVDVGPSGDDLEMIAVSGNQEARIWRADGAVDVIDRSVYLADAANGAPQLMSSEDAREKSKQVLDAIGIAMEDRVLVHDDFFWIDMDVHKAIDGADEGDYESIALRNRVVYRRQIDGLPTWGPGAEATVEFGHDGALAKASVQAWTPLQPAGEVELIDIEMLLAQMADRGNQLLINNIRQPMDEIQVDQIEVGYWVETRGNGQDKLMPCYGLACTVQDGENEPTGMLLVINAAVPAPKVEILIENDPQGCFNPGEPICFVANVDTFDGQFEIKWIDQTTGENVSMYDHFMCYAFPENLARSTSLRTIEARVQDSMGQVRSATATVCVRVPGDLDGDDTVGVNDLLVVLDAWNQQGDPFTGGDVNGDGLSGIDDLLLILSGWTP